MKKIIVLSTALIFSAGIYAQDANTTAKNPDVPVMSNGFIGILGGYSISTGNWTHTSYVADQYGAWLPNNSDNLSAGFAGNGSTFGVEGGWYFCQYIGIGGHVSYSNFVFKGLDSISAGYRGSFDVDQVTTSVSGGYSIWNFMTGLYFRYPLTDKFSVTAKLLGGFTSATTPEIDVAVEDGGVEDGTFTQQKCTANSFGYMAGIGISYKLNNYLGINLQGTYASSQPDFKIDNTNRPVNVGRLLTEYNQPLTNYNICLGVTYLIGK
ncbi:MAG TPA: hypothetical protein VK783_05305 [Bacteroidia bacterium]|nr:hypothetical protein [Bacteroidia bacterium]